MKLSLFGLLLCFPLFMQAQHILYSEPEQDDSRKTEFEIIGRVSGNILVYKSNVNKNAISIYGPDMNLIRHVPLAFTERLINIDFIQYADFFYMLIEYQNKGIVHLTAIKMDGNCQKIGDPVELDTTQVSGHSGKIYTTIVSEDKQRIMALKINTKNPKTFVFTTFLFGKDLELIDRHRINMTVNDHADQFNNFDLDNDGQLVFTRFARVSSGAYLAHASFVMKDATADTFAIRDIGANDRILDELKFKIDNYNKRYILSALYYKQKRGDIEGIYTVIWDKTSDSKLKENVTIFNDDLRSLAKSSESNNKMAFNDFFIKNIVVKKDGGYLVISEAEFVTSRGTAFNRSDYLYGQMPLDYYYNPYYSPYNPYSAYRYGNGSLSRFSAENILVLSFDKNSNLEWSNVLPKSQFDDESDLQISFKMVNTGGEIHFLYNEAQKRTLLLTDQGIASDGKVTRYPTFHNLDKGYEFVPRHGKQISSNQIIIPCFYKSYLCFAKVVF